jgi:tRNA 5-methylaminomethyl-2-thiouridine biosynthesis bifunctional protein
MRVSSAPNLTRNIHEREPQTSEASSSKMKIENASITWLDSGLPYSTQFQDIYYSRDDEMAESRHVFIEANKLSERWADNSDIDSFHIGELGFGSGLNFLQVMKLWSEQADKPSRLHYIAFEKHPLTHQEMCSIHKRWPDLLAQSSELLDHYVDHSAGCHRLSLSDGITVDLYFGDAREQLLERMTDASSVVQCWFLDGFSPATNVELWDEPLMHLLAQCSDENTTLSSYSVAGHVRRALNGAGFETNKIEGFGKKRHSLFATFPGKDKSRNSENSAEPLTTPWFVLPKPLLRAQRTKKSVTVIGAGLAGCSTAHSLAQRGWQVTVIDAGSEAANAASGNSQLALRCRLFNAPSAEAQFFLHAYLFALRQFRQLRKAKSIDWNDCGVLQLLNAINKKNPLKAENLEQLYSEQIVHQLSEVQASSKAGLTVREPAWYFPSGGAIGPSSLCQAYLAHDNIESIFDTQVSDLQRDGDRWLLNTGEFESDVVVIANSQDALQFRQCAQLPLLSLRGQTTEIATTENSASLNCVVSGARTVFPAVGQRHLISASYANNTELEANSEDSRENIALAATTFEETELLGKQAIAERVSLRSSSPDRLPLVGMAPDLDRMGATYAELSRNAKAQFRTAGEYHDDLYLNIGHGSNGLASCPLSAEFLASLIERENLPLSREMINSLNPCRFLIKDLKKQR